MVITSFVAFCLLFTLGVIGQLSGFILTLRERLTAGFWLLACGALCMTGAAWLDRDPTLLLGQGLFCALCVRMLWGGIPPMMRAAFPLPLRRFVRDNAMLCKSVGLFVFFGCVVLCIPLLAPDTKTLHAFIRTVTGFNNAPPGTWAHVREGTLFALIAGSLCCLAIPRQALSFVSGLLFGAWYGALWATVGTTLGCALTFGAGRAIACFMQARNARKNCSGEVADPCTQGSAAPPSLFQRLYERYRPHIYKLNHFISRAPFFMSVLIRLFPSGNNMLFSLLGGTMRLPALPFIGGSCLGYVPQNLIFALLGSGVYTDGPWRVAVGAGLFALASLLGWWAWKRYQKEVAA